MPATPAVPHAGSTAKKLEVLLAYHLEAVKNLQGSIALLTETAVATKAVNGQSVLLKALELDDARRGLAEPPEETDDVPRHPTRKPGGATDTRARTAALLATFSPTKAQPSTYDGRVLTSLVRHGFLRKQGSNWLRTAKTFYISPYQTKQAKLGTPPAAERHAMPRRIGSTGPVPQRNGPTARRWQIKQALDRMSRTVPKPWPGGLHQTGALISNGYLVHKGDGYLRTAKPYHVSSHHQKEARRGKPKPKRSSGSFNAGPQRTARRARSAKLLAAFNTDTPVLASDVPNGLRSGSVGSLLRRGYLKKSGDGYLRTDKEFVV